ncbi:CAP domain-containing protein [Streptomyces sp. MRC013]|uniref:CAP domain-containing protein n=1 Tax=Streptomyces sp. MRC013 TaxID=2898276 RepID=UPI0020276936|nr:CAP domain-containing protein [Streptomyces sp. MRC013]URM89473.1 CAP domain-containing protein [Streptomyces sp. MRC013]
MGRHRRSGAAPAADAYAAGAAGEPRGHRGTRRRKRTLPLRGGLLGASAAVAVGVAAVTSGILPGGGTFVVSGDVPQERTRPGGVSELDAQGRAHAVPDTGAPVSPGPAAVPSATPSPAASSKPPSGTPSPEPSAPSSSPARTGTASPAPVRTWTPSVPSRTEVPAPDGSTTPPPSRTATSRAVAMEAAVLDLVNRERAAVGCSPVRASTELGDLARAFSQDMAERDFFSHTDPDGDGPWERAAQAGVEGLGGENIARGQADAQAVMDSWMNSDGHRANILNCDFKRLGVGVHIAGGGPWWTQDFGF